jgi:hypothetical protein
MLSLSITAPLHSLSHTHILAPLPALSHLIDIMDEEMHNISSITVELIATNGNLDPSDSIFLRSPMSLLFLDNFATPPNTTFIHIALNATVDVYEQALRAIYFDNSEIEPTIFNTTDSRMNLTRVVVIRITDTNFPDSGLDNAELGTTTTEIRIGINIQPINDNRPRILILAPDGCATGSVNVSDAQANIRRRRRDVRAASNIRKRSTHGFSNVMVRNIMLHIHVAYFSATGTSLYRKLPTSMHIA